MSKRTSKSVAPAAIEAPVTPAVEEQPSTEVAAAEAPASAAAVILAPAATAAADKLRKSAVKNPVAQVWANCHNAFALAAAEGKSAPSRAALHVINTAHGIAYYTSRTQIQAYLKASRNGTVLPAKLPKGLTIN
jgi:hypothetical protein